MNMVCEIHGRGIGSRCCNLTILYQSHNPFKCLYTWLRIKTILKKKHWTNMDERYSAVFMRFDIYKGKRNTCQK